MSLAVGALVSGLGLGLLVSAASSANAVPSVLTGGQTLTAGEQLQSHDGRYALVMEANGDLVEAITGDGRAVWASDTAGHRGASAVLERDGELVVVAVDGTRLWSDHARSTGCAALNVLDDGAVEVDGARAAIWRTGMLSEMVGGDTLLPGQTLFSSTHDYRLVMQADGNLVEYNRSGVPLWHSGTNGNPGAYADLQPDGDLVLFDASGTTLLWSSHTGHAAGDVLSLGRTGDATLESIRHTTVWSTHTAGAAAGTGDISPAARRGTARACRLATP